MTDRSGGTGHNLFGANHIIFLGSLYAMAYEEQAIGIRLSNPADVTGRIARQGQRRVPKAYIIASRKFPGILLRWKRRNYVEKRRKYCTNEEMELQTCEELSNDYHTQEAQSHVAENADLTQPQIIAARWTRENINFYMERYTISYQESSFCHVSLIVWGSCCVRPFLLCQRAFEPHLRNVI
jgi:hypothetical protein